MPFQHVGKQPSGVLVASPLGWFLRHALKKTFHQGQSPFSSFIDSLCRIARLERRPLDFLSVDHEISANVLKQLSEPRSRKAVLAVVRFDGFQYFVWDRCYFVQFQSTLQIAQRLLRISKVCRTLETEEDFKVFERVSLHTRAKRLLQNSVQIDKDS